MATLKAQAVVPDLAEREALLAQARAAATSWALRPGRDATIDYEPKLSPETIRVKAITTTNQEGARAYRAVENAMEGVTLAPYSYIRLTDDDGNVLNSRVFAE